MSSFGDFIRSVREKKGLTVTEVAEAAGINHSHLSRIENGERNPPKPITLNKLAKILGIPYKTMLKEAGALDDLDESEIDAHFNSIDSNERLNAEILKLFSRIKLISGVKKSEVHKDVISAIIRTIAATKVKFKFNISTDLSDPAQEQELVKKITDETRDEKFKMVLIENLNKLLDEHLSSTNLYTPVDDLIQIPIYGEIRAGYNSLAREEIVGYEVTSRSSLGDGEHFYLIVKGDSMIEEGIHEGMRVLVRKQHYCENGKIGVVIVDGEEGTLKRVFYDGDNVILQASNRHIPPRSYPINEVMIQGQVKKVEFDV